ncbi:MAG: hypothetical protein NC302_11090, partial [Bacteroidales bacterium]|nr:hypothetical protein [Bacteroidales bacterium]MCM1415285.1 hypothetical protein [bacterium]
AGIAAFILIVVISIVRIYNARSPLQDVYFMEYRYGEGGTIIHKYDVSKRKTVTVAILEEGHYSNCKIDRTENYIIGEYDGYENETKGLLRYNLSDGTAEKITGKEAEIMEERIKGAEDKLPERSDLPDEVRNIVGNGPISWSAGGKTAAFSGDGREKIYLYHADTKTCKRILSANLWAQTFGSKVGLDASGKYVFYESNINYFFGAADVTIMIYDTQTGRRKKMFKRRYTMNNFVFVQEMD